MAMRHYNQFFDYNVAALYLAWTDHIHPVGVSLMCVIEQKHGYSEALRLSLIVRSSFVQHEQSNAFSFRGYKTCVVFYHFSFH